MNNYVMLKMELKHQQMKDLDWRILEFTTNLEHFLKFGLDWIRK